LHASGYAEDCASVRYYLTVLDKENQTLDAPHRLDALSARSPYRRIVLPPPRAKQFRQLHLELAVLILQPPQPVHFGRTEPVVLTLPLTERRYRDSNHVTHIRNRRPCLCAAECEGYSESGVSLSHDKFSSGCPRHAKPTQCDGSPLFGVLPTSFGKLTLSRVNIFFNY
jgi:hypothetical protein